MDLARDGKIKYCNIDSLDSEHEFKTLINWRRTIFVLHVLVTVCQNIRTRYVLKPCLELAVEVSFKLIKVNLIEIQLKYYWGEKL